MTPRYGASPIAKRHYEITLADALSAHERALSFGGVRGIANLSLVQSAIARPYNGHYRSIAKKSAALVQSVSLNHGFADGNKRTTIILLYTLLEKSGYELFAYGHENIDEAAEKMVLDVVTKQLNYNQLTAWFKARIRKQIPAG